MLVTDFRSEKTCSKEKRDIDHNHTEIARHFLFETQHWRRRWDEFFGNKVSVDIRLTSQDIDFFNTVVKCFDKSSQEDMLPKRQSYFASISQSIKLGIFYRMAAARGVYTALLPFKKSKDVGTTLDSFNKYIKRAEMVFDTEDINEDKKKKALIQLWGGDEMMSLFEHEGKVTATDTFVQAIDKVKQAIQGQINEVYPVFKLFCKMPQNGTPKY